MISPEAAGKQVIVHDLPKIHVVSLDLKGGRISPSSNKDYYQAMLKDGKQFRSLVFGSPEEMHAAIDFILTSQKLPPQRSQQYKYLREFDLHCLAGEGSVVEHRLTKEKFVRKTISKAWNTAVEIELMRNEIEVLKACRSQRSAVTLVDVIEDSQHISIIFKYFE